MRNIKLTIEYDGTAFSGWQSQNNARAVQDVVANAVRELTGEDCKLVGASRTDAGVHALGQTANFFTSSKIPADKFSYALNTVLPADVTIRSSEEADAGFHSRFSAKGKKYRYLMFNSRLPSALLRDRAYHVPLPLNIDWMKDAAGCFLGKHDFSAFRATGSSVRTSERTITHISLVKNGELIEFEISGDGFLYNMVRIIAGTLVYVGLGKIKSSEIPLILESRDRERAGKTAPAQGLYLVEVFY